MGGALEFLGITIVDEEMAVACTEMVPGRNTECSYTRDDYNVAVLGVFGTDGTGAGARDQRGRGFHVEGLLWQLAQEPVGQIRWIMDHDSRQTRVLCMSLDSFSSSSSSS